MCGARLSQLFLQALAITVEAGNQLFVELLHPQVVGGALKEIAQGNQFQNAQFDGARGAVDGLVGKGLSLIHISEPTRPY